jgi:hypothetical protein
VVSGLSAVEAVVRIVDDVDQKSSEIAGGFG